VGCQTVSVLTFLTGDATKLKRGHVKRYAVALKRLGALAVPTFPGTSSSFNLVLRLDSYGPQYGALAEPPSRGPASDGRILRFCGHETGVKTI